MAFFKAKKAINPLGSHIVNGGGPHSSVYIEFEHFP